MRDGHAVDAMLLGIGRLHGTDSQIEVEMIEGGGAGLTGADADQQAQADDPGGGVIGIGADNVGKALDFLEGKEALTVSYRLLTETLGGIFGQHFPLNGENEHFAQHLSKWRKGMFAIPVVGDFTAINRVIEKLGL
jgi:hypothetical protein